MDEQDIADLAQAFDGFKAAHNARLDEIEKKLNRNALSGGGDGPGLSLLAERKALAGFVRDGSEAELKALSVGSDPDGGYLVAPALSEGIYQRIFDVSPMARLSRQVTIGAGDAWEEPMDLGDMTAAWVAEREARPATTTPELRLLRVPVHEIYAAPLVTQKLLDDSRFDLGAWLEQRIADRFARSEGAAFISGEGTGRPRGLLNYPTAATADGARPWGTFQHVNTGHASGFIAATPTASPADCLLELVSALRTPFRPNARWTMNRKTAGVVRKLKDSEGRFIWADAREGQPATLLGFPAELDEEMPDVGAGNLPIAFGDFQRGYVVVRKPGLRLLRDPFSAKPNVMFYAYARVGGGAQDTEAVKLLRVAETG